MKDNVIGILIVHKNLWFPIVISNNSIIFLLLCYRGVPRSHMGRPGPCQAATIVACSHYTVHCNRVHYSKKYNMAHHDIPWPRWAGLLATPLLLSPLLFLLSSPAARYSSFFFSFLFSSQSLDIPYVQISAILVPLIRVS